MLGFASWMGLKWFRTQQCCAVGQGKQSLSASIITKFL